MSNEASFKYRKFSLRALFLVFFTYILINLSLCEFTIKLTHFKSEDYNKEAFFNKLSNISLRRKKVFLNKIKQVKIQDLNLKQLQK